VSTEPAADAEFLDRQYNPRTQVPEFASYFARWKEAALEVRQSRHARLNLRYGLLPAEKLDFFPAEGASNPLLVFLHGGYWRAFDMSSPVRVRRLRRHGVSVVPGD
jgi:arylformamidase